MLEKKRKLQEKELESVNGGCSENRNERNVTAENENDNILVRSNLTDENCGHKEVFKKDI